MNENDDCVVNGRSEFQEDRIICWDCQTPQVQESSDCFHQDKIMKNNLKGINIWTKRPERLLRELNNSGGKCVILFLERVLVKQQESMKESVKKQEWSWDKRGMCSCKTCLMEGKQVGCREVQVINKKWRNTRTEKRTWNREIKWVSPWNMSWGRDVRELECKKRWLI